MGKIIWLESVSYQQFLHEQFENQGTTISIYMHVCVYIYIYRERERDKDKDKERRVKHRHIAQLTGALEYTSCFSTVG